jgi:hypothetical protein
MPAAAATTFLHSVGRCLPLGSLAASFAVVVAKPDSSDMWMLSGVLVSMLPTLADIGRTSGKRILSKLGGTLAFGMSCPLFIHHQFGDVEIVRSMESHGWTWFASAFCFGVMGWGVARAVFGLIDRKVIQPIHKLSGGGAELIDPETGDIFRPDTDMIGKPTSRSRNPLEDPHKSRTSGNDSGPSD